MESFRRRWRSLGHFYIDVGNVNTAATTKNIYVLMTYEKILNQYDKVFCTFDINSESNQVDITQES